MNITFPYTSKYNMLNKFNATYLAAVFLSSTTLAGNFYDHKAEGWHWYEYRYQESDVRDQKKNEVKSTPEPKTSKLMTASEKLQSFKQEIEKRLHLALVYPTLENVKAYQEIQKVLMDRSELFSKLWMEVVYTNPHLDETIKHPVSQAARHVYLDERYKRKEETIKALARKFGLFFFFKSSCPYCHQFAPIVKKFTQSYGWQVLAISMDGSQLPEFPQAQRDNGAAAKLNVTHLPTLLAVEPKSGKVIPLRFGMSSQDQIEDRIRVLVKTGDLQ
jgi:conjugal transfer pilus assembly protein TraF